MKKPILASLLFLTFVCSVWAYEPVWQASHTATADTAQVLCLSHSFLIGTSTSTTGGKGLLHEICVNDPSSASGYVKVYNSSSTAVNPYMIMTATAAVNAVCVPYDISFSSGLVYTTTAVNDVTFVYACY